MPLGDHGCGVKSRVKVVEPGENRLVHAAAGIQVCAERNGSSSLTSVLWEIREGTDGDGRCAVLCSSSLTVCSSHALPPQWLLHCSASPLKFLSSTHIQRSTAAPPPSPLFSAGLLVLAYPGRSSLPAQPLIINMIPSRWSETHPSDEPASVLNLFLK